MLKLQWQRSGNAVALQPKRSVVDNAVDNAVAYATDNAADNAGSKNTIDNQRRPQNKHSLQLTVNNAIYM